MFLRSSLLEITTIMLHAHFLHQCSSLKPFQKRGESPNVQGPASKCQDIYDMNRMSPSGFYDIQINNQVVKVYCYFHNPQSSVIRQFNDIEGNAQEWNVHEPVPVGNGDPEGAMEMQFEEHEIPTGIGPHFTQPIIDEQEKMYWNKTSTIQNLIEANNERDREKKKQQTQQHQTKGN